MKRFDWLATESAPSGFPMEVVSGNFYDKKAVRSTFQTAVLFITDGVKGYQLMLLDQIKNMFPTALISFVFPMLKMFFIMVTLNCHMKNCINDLKMGTTAPLLKRTLRIDEWLLA